MRFDRGGLVALGILIVAIIALIYMYSRSFPQDTAAANSAKTITAVFACSSSRSISAAFESDSVRLTLSDGREFTLPRAASADGARYSNSDESFVFWNKGNTAFIEEGGTTTYVDCATSGPHD